MNTQGSSAGANPGGGDLTADASDAELVAAALDGQQSAYAALLARYQQSAFRLARHHLGDEAEAMDVTQECFIAAFAALKRYDPDRPFKAWLLRIALNKCRDWGRRRKVRNFFLLAQPLTSALEVADIAQGPEDALASAQEVELLRQAVAALPAALKDPLILCTLEGLSQQDAAAMLGISRKAVEVRIYRARQKLAQVLEGKG